MKAYTCIFFYLLMMHQSFAQDADKTIDAVGQKSPGKHIIKFSPLGLIPAEGLAYPVFSYEKVIRPRKSLQLNSTVNYYSDNGYFTKNLGIGLEYRKYYSKKKTAPEGKYWCFGFGANSLAAYTSDGTTEKLSSFNGKFIVGRQWFYNGKFTIDLSGGIAAVSTNYKIGTIYKTEHVNGPVPSLNLSIGYILK